MSDTGPDPTGDEDEVAAAAATGAEAPESVPGAYEQAREDDDAG